MAPGWTVAVVSSRARRGTRRTGRSRARRTVERARVLMRAGGRRALVLDPEPAYPAAPLVANYQMTRHLLGYVGYSHFFTGAFINRSGPGRDSDFVYAALRYTL